MDKDKLEAIILAIGNLTKRAFSLGEKIDFIENFHLEIALLCFKSKFLNQKIHGLKMIAEIIK